MKNVNKYCNLSSVICEYFDDIDDFYDTLDELTSDINRIISVRNGKKKKQYVIRCDKEALLKHIDEYLPEDN